MRLTIIFLLFLSVQVFARTEIDVHQYYIKVAGLLPEPHKVFEIEIELDQETNATKHFTIEIGGKDVAFPESELLKLKGLNLSSMKVKHGIYRSKELPLLPLKSYLKDYITLSFTSGNIKRVDWVESGEDKHLWGYDKVYIHVFVGKSATVRFEALVKPIRAKKTNGITLD